MTVGPFDFEDGFRVPSTAWDTLLKISKTSQIYVGAVNRVVPLDKPDVGDTDKTGRFTSHLALRWNILNGTGLS